MRDDMPADIPIIAIVRGIVPSQCSEVGQTLYRAGIRTIEVPLNSPDPFTSIAILRSELNADCTVGAGTVLSVTDVQRTHEAGGRLVVAPNVDVEIIRCALELGMEVMPGFATATEAFQAIHAGATSLKLFPAVTYGPQHLRAMRAVLPPRIKVFPVGGINATQIEAWVAAGADGFAFGSELFSPSLSLDAIESKAIELMRPVSRGRQPK
jgi:2-dehydro-3-deoxyphosphogalactonate aldolase